jgi:flagellar FliL protein
MAEEITEEVETVKEEKSSNMLMIVIIVVFALIIILGGIAVVLLSGDDEPQQKQSAPQTKERAKTRQSSGNSLAPSRPLSDIGILYPLDTFTINLKSDQGRRYLKVAMSLELSDEELSAELSAKGPVIKDRIIRILTSKNLEEISSKKGKQKVSEQIIDTLNTMVTDGSVQGLYFTEFVIQ